MDGSSTTLRREWAIVASLEESKRLSSYRFIRLRRNLPAIRTFPHARIVELRAGHAPQLETPEAFEAEVVAFVRALPG